MKQVVEVIATLNYRSRNDGTLLTAERRAKLDWPRPLAGTYSTVKVARPPTTISVPSGNCWLEAYHLPACKAVPVSTQSQSPPSPHGEKVLICEYEGK